MSHHPIFSKHVATLFWFCKVLTNQHDFTVFPQASTSPEVVLGEPTIRRAKHWRFLLEFWDQTPLMAWRSGVLLTMVASRFWTTSTGAGNHPIVQHNMRCYHLSSNTAGTATTRAMFLLPMQSPLWFGMMGWKFSSFSAPIVPTLTYTYQSAILRTSSL